MIENIYLEKNKKRFFSLNIPRTAKNIFFVLFVHKLFDFNFILYENIWVTVYTVISIFVRYC